MPLWLVGVYLQDEKKKKQDRVQFSNKTSSMRSLSPTGLNVSDFYYYVNDTFFHQFANLPFCINFRQG